MFLPALLVLARSRRPASGFPLSPLDLRLAGRHGAVLAGLLLTMLASQWQASHSGQWQYPLLALWMCLSGALLATATVTFLSPRALRWMVAGFWRPVSLALLLGLLSFPAFALLRDLWNAPDSAFTRFLQFATLSLVRFVLGLFMHNVAYEASTSTIRNGTFEITVQGACAGLEGVGLILLLVGGWLFLKHRELRLGRAIWLLPAAVLVIWPLNTLRIAALFVIGAYGHPEVAIGGFHSNAGWILFNATAMCFLLAVHHVGWFRAEMPVGDVPYALPAESGEANTAAVYLLPFLTILAVSLLTQAASSGFEWLYPLRFLSAGVVLLALRKHYRGMDWKFGPWGIAGGLAVFAMWLALAKLPVLASAQGHAADVISAGLSGLTTAQRAAWIAFRVLAAVVTVPIAEELAFRGYLARRLVSDDVESVSFGRLPLFAMLLSSLAFGVMHGHMWIAGTVAGMVFAGLARWRGRLGEAVAAHSVANLLLAAWVLTRGDYGLW